MTGNTLEQLREIVRDMDDHCDKLDAIGGGHAAQPIRNFAERIEAALRLSAGADEFLPNGRRCEWQDNIGRWWPVTIVGWTPSTYDAVLDDGSEARGYAPGRFRAAAPRHETGEG